MALEFTTTFRLADSRSTDENPCHELHEFHWMP